MFRVFIKACAITALTALESFAQDGRLVWERAGWRVVEIGRATDPVGCMTSKLFTDIGASAPTLNFSVAHLVDGVVGLAVSGPRSDRFTASTVDILVDDLPVVRVGSSQMPNSPVKLIGPIPAQALDAVIAGKVLTLRVPTDQIVLRLAGSEDAIRQTALCALDLVIKTYIQRGLTAPTPEYRVLHVISDNVLNLRSEPTGRAPLVAAIPGGSTRITGTGNCRPGVRSDYLWCPVTWAGRSGWVALGGLMPVLPPLPRLQQTPPTTASIQSPTVPSPTSPPSTAAPQTTARPSAATAPQVSSGTGFFVSRTGHILTNAHVVDQCQSIGVQQPGAFALKRASLLASDKRNDLALLRIAEPIAIEPLPLRRQVRVGESAAVFGFPLAGTVASAGIFTTGSISALAGLGDDTSKVQMMVPIQPGNSGGPVLDSFGNVVGVVVGKLDGVAAAVNTGVIPEQVNFAIKGAVAASFLEANGVVADEPKTDRRLENPDLADLARASTVVVLCVGSR